MKFPIKQYEEGFTAIFITVGFTIAMAILFLIYFTYSIFIYKKD